MGGARGRGNLPVPSSPLPPGAALAEIKLERE